MAKSLGASELQYSISQDNAITGVPKSTIRFWEKEFKDFLNPARTSGNQRRYDTQAVETIQQIDKLVNDEGYTLEGARRKLVTENGRKGAATGREDVRINELAETMSDFLLKKLFERVRETEARRQNGSNNEIHN